MVVTVVVDGLCTFVHLSLHLSDSNFFLQEKYRVVDMLGMDLAHYYTIHCLFRDVLRPLVCILILILPSSGSTDWTIRFRLGL